MGAKSYYRGGFFTNNKELFVKLKKLKQEFIEGKITKSEYINQMYNHHKKLFEYSEFIKNTDIGKIEIDDGRVIMTSRELGIKIICEENDERIPPIEILNFEYYEKMTPVFDHSDLNTIHLQGK